MLQYVSTLGNDDIPSDVWCWIRKIVTWPNKDVIPIVFITTLLTWIKTICTYMFVKITYKYRILNFKVNRLVSSIIICDSLSMSFTNMVNIWDRRHLFLRSSVRTRIVIHTVRKCKIGKITRTSPYRNWWLLRLREKYKWPVDREHFRNKFREWVQVYPNRQERNN